MSIALTEEQLQNHMNSDKEEVIGEFQPNFFRSLLGTFCGIGILILIPFTLGLALLVLPIWYLNCRFTNYTLTNQRIIIKRGILVRHEDEIELYRVKDVKNTMSLPNQIFKIGTLQIISSELSKKGSHLNLEIKNIHDAKALRETLRTLTENMRKKRNVREFDVS